MPTQAVAKAVSFFKTSWVIAFPLQALDKQARAEVGWAELSYGDSCYIVASSGRRRAGLM